MNNTFQKKYTLAERSSESRKVLRKYPDRLPVLLQTNSGDIVLDKIKYLVPIDLTVGQFLHVIRKRIKLRAEEGLYLFLGGNTLVSTSAMMSDIYAKHRDPDNFVYFFAAKENTFGSC